MRQVPRRAREFLPESVAVRVGGAGPVRSWEYH
jgi:hypothetical protein